ncbi:MAG: VapC toxin family PIN domain ribonuclease [Bryobacterales bacterium]|nr:VapC toxin family PIN domain ribonuclease [Bryobacterales bacterium]
MTVRLLDVNLLVSLLDSAHVHHDAVSKWFRTVAAVEGWATCPLTENGLIRVVSHVSYPNLRLSPGQVAESLALFKSSFSGIHRFWPDSISLSDSERFDLAVLTGARQTADAYLAGLAFCNGGRLATLDGGVAWRAVRGADASLVERLVPGRNRPDS